MHEYSTTYRIVETVRQEAEKHRAKKVLEVHLAIGRLTFLSIDQVRHLYPLLVKGTLMDGSKLVIEEKEGVVECSGCGYRGPLNYQNDPSFHLTYPTLSCPKCRSVVKIVEGRECVVKQVRLEV
ncbi:MAG: hydrogenase maturation nickel metallochaperone HypA [Nitrososphaerales archaeon]